MRVVVTGGSGRVGRYVVKELISHGHTVTVFDRIQPPSLEGVRWLRGDIEILGDVISSLNGSDAVIHLAAYPNPTQEVLPHILFRNNVLGTFNIHEAAYCMGVKRVVSTSSAAVVGWPYNVNKLIPEYLPIDEAHPLFPQDPYSLGKACEEQIARSYALKCGMETIVLRPERVLLPETSAELRKQGGVRPAKFTLFSYVDARDLAAAYRAAVESPGLQHEIIFIVANDSTTSEPLCDLLPRLLPELGTMAQALTGTRGSISAERARRLLNWSPSYSWRVRD